MLALILLAILIIILFGTGFTLHILWVVAFVALIVWLLGFAVRPRSGGRWYYW